MLADNTITLPAPLIEMSYVVHQNGTVSNSSNGTIPVGSDGSG